MDFGDFDENSFDSFLNLSDGSPGIGDPFDEQPFPPTQNQLNPPPAFGGGGFTLDYTPEPGLDDGYTGAMLQFDPNFSEQIGYQMNPQIAPNHITTIINTPMTQTTGPIFTHRKSVTEPLSRPSLPTLRGKKQKRDVIFQVRNTRKVPSNQPVMSPPEPGSEDDNFQQLCADKNTKINPVELGFIPSKFWPNQEIPFGDIVADFFQRKNNVNCRFSHKLYDAIQIGKLLPHMLPFVGVEWVSETILKVNKKRFARLLGIHSIDGSLFHQQGNFSTHGFAEVSAEEARSQLGDEEFNSMDLETVRLLKHVPGIFVRDATEEQLDRCKWVSSKKKPLSE